MQTTRREIAADNFFTGIFETALDRIEIVTAGRLLHEIQEPGLALRDRRRVRRPHLPSDLVWCCSHNPFYPPSEGNAVLPFGCGQRLRCGPRGRPSAGVNIGPQSRVKVQGRLTRWLDFSVVLLQK